MYLSKKQVIENIFVVICTYIIIQNKWHRGKRWKFKFTLAATPLLICNTYPSFDAVNLLLIWFWESFCVNFLVTVFGISLFHLRKV
jgi:hypothetical protein